MEKSCCKEFNIKRHDEQTSINKIHSINNVFIMGQPLWKTVWNFLRKLKMGLPFDLVSPLLGLYPKNPETPIPKKLCIPMFIAAQFTIAKCWKQPKCPSANEWIKKLWYIYTMEFYAAERKKELIPFATAWMEHYAK